MILASLVFALLGALSSCGSMLLAAVVLALSGRKYLCAAATQGAAPLLAVALGALGLLTA